MADFSAGVSDGWVPDSSSAAWYDGAVQDFAADPEGSVRKYGSLAKGLPDYAAGRIREAAIAGTQAAAGAACLAAGAAAPVCAGVVLVIVPIVSALFDAFRDSGPRADVRRIAQDPEAVNEVSAREMASLINASEDLRGDEERGLKMLVDLYSDGMQALTGKTPDPGEARALAISALTKSADLGGAGYSWSLIQPLPSVIDQNERPGWGVRDGQTWEEHWNDVCDPSKNNFLICTPGNSLWSSVITDPGAGRGSYLSAVRELQARIYEFPTALVKAASLITDYVTKQGAIIAAGQARNALAYGEAAKHAGSEYLAQLQVNDPEKYQAMSDAVASGTDPALVSQAIDASRSPEIGNTSSEAVMPAGSAGIGTAVLLIGGLGLLMFLAKRGGR